MNTDMVLDALEQALHDRGMPKNVIHHSDRGVQYLSIRYTNRLEAANLRASVGTTGDSYDNALAETVNGLYKTEVIESLNSVIRHATKKRKIFPTDDSVKKVVYLAIMAASKKWTMPIQNWKAAMNRFSIMFEERVTKYF